MPAYLYRRVNKDGRNYLSQVQLVRLAGHNAIYSLWEQNHKPINQGWTILGPDLVRYVLKHAEGIGDYEIIIDAAPSVKTLVDLVKLLEIKVYTDGGEKKEEASWSTLMLIVKDVCWKDNISEREKARLTKEFLEPEQDGKDIITFLYIHGDRRSWNFGRLGQMNGAWLDEKARKYFRSYF